MQKFHFCTCGKIPIELYRMVNSVRFERCTRLYTCERNWNHRSCLAVLVSELSTVLSFSTRFDRSNTTIGLV